MLATRGARLVDDDIGLDRPVGEGIDDLKCGDFDICEDETPADIKRTARPPPRRRRRLEAFSASSEAPVAGGGPPRWPRARRAFLGRTIPAEVFPTPANGRLNIAASRTLWSWTACSARSSWASWSAPMISRRAA